MRSRNSRFILAGGALVMCFLAGCETVSISPVPADRFSKGGASQDDFMKDRYQCLREGQRSVSSSYITGQNGFIRGSGAGGVVVSQSLFRSCLSARGYNLDPNGPLVAPPEDRVNYGAP